MSLRNEARQLAENTIHELAQQGIAAAVELIERRINWRWGPGAELLALEAEHMTLMLSFLPDVRLRRVRVAYWRARWIRFSARAWAVNPEFASACGICHPDQVPRA